MHALHLFDHLPKDSQGLGGLIARDAFTGCCMPQRPAAPHHDKNVGVFCLVVPVIGRLGRVSRGTLRGRFALHAGGGQEDLCGRHVPADDSYHA